MGEISKLVRVLEAVSAEAGCFRPMPLHTIRRPWTKNLIPKFLEELSNYRGLAVYLTPALLTLGNCGFYVLVSGCTAIAYPACLLLPFHLREVRKACPRLRRRELQRTPYITCEQSLTVPPELHPWYVSLIGPRTFSSLYSSLAPLPIALVCPAAALPLPPASRDAALSNNCLVKQSPFAATAQRNQYKNKEIDPLLRNLKWWNEPALKFRREAHLIYLQHREKWISYSRRRRRRRRKKVMET